MPILDAFPKELIAGDTLRVVRGYADFEAPTWTATLYGENKDHSFSQAAVASGTDHSFTISATDSASFKVGRYRLNVRVTDGTIVETVETAWLEVRANLAATGKADPRSWARQALDAVEAAILNKATTDQLSFSIRDRSVSRIPLVELMQLRTELRSQVRTEEQGEARGLGRNIKVRFVR